MLFTQEPQCLVHNDEGSIRQLRRAEDDRCGRAQPAQDPHAQDPTARQHSAQIHLRQAHPGQVGEVLHEDSRSRAHRRTT